MKRVAGERTYLVLHVDEVLCLGDGVDVGVRNGVLGSVPRGPWATASDQLDVRTIVLALLLPLLAPGTVQTPGEVALDATKHLAGLVLSFLEEAPAGRGVGNFFLELLVFCVAIKVVLLAPDVVPPVGEVKLQALGDGPDQRDADIRPAHPRELCAVKLVLLPLVNSLEVVDSCVIVVLTREDDSVHIAGVVVGDGVSAGVPTAEAGVEATHEGNVAVNQAQLLVVGPEEHDIVVSTIESLQAVPRHLGQAESAKGQVVEGAVNLSVDVLLGGHVIRMPEDLDVLVELLQRVLGVLRVAGQGLGDLLVHDDPDLNASLCCGLEHVVQAVLVVLRRGPAQEQLWGQPPVQDKDGLLGLCKIWPPSVCPSPYFSLTPQLPVWDGVSPSMASESAQK